MSGCHLYLAANFHCPSAGQRKTGRQTLVMEDVEGLVLFFLESLFLGKEANLLGREEKKIKQQQTVPANSLRNKEKQEQPNEGGV